MHNAFLAKLWATLLPYLLMWEYNNFTKLLANTFTSSISKLIGDKLCSSDFKAWISPTESPSRIALQNPNSNAKDNALRAADASISSTLYAWGIFCEQETKTAPLLSRITTSIPDTLDAPKTAPSKFIFTNPAGGHHHLVPALLLVITWTFGTCKFSRYYANTSFARSTTWWSKTACKCNQVLFLWFHTIQAVYANNSSDFPSAISQDNSSMTSTNSTSDLKFHVPRSAHLL